MPGHTDTFDELEPDWQGLDKTVLDAKIRTGDIQVMGAGTVQYEGIDIPLELIYGPLPEGAAYWEVADLNGDGVPEVFAASTSTAGEETIYNVYDITEQGGVETTPYEKWRSGSVSASGYGVNITCTLADGCSISLVPDYGFWLMIRHMFKALDDYPTGGFDEAGMWAFFTEKLRQASNGDIDLDTFISDIENSGYPFSEAMRQRFIKQFENAQYNGLIERIEDVFATGDGQLIQEFFDKYENVGIANNTFILENAFSLMNPSQIVDRMILGDGDVGITVDICSSTVTTNCVDPTAIKDLWEDFGRHIRVIFKGLEIPGLPEWLPLPGIIRIPTIGEIWDKVIGPFNDAAKEVFNDCRNEDDDGDGVKNTASYCLENRDYVAIITKGILDGSGTIIDATTEAVKGIVDKALETLDCVTDPAACASKIKDVLEGVLGGADPTQPGLPPWMRVIIIGGQYGDEILKELEKIFNEDIDGDGTIGVGPTQEYCADGVTIKEDAEGTNCPEYAPNGYCQDGTTKKQDAEGTNCSEYAPNGYCQDGTTKKDDAAGTNCAEYSEFGYCQDGTTKKQDAAGTNCSEYAEFGYCQDGTTKKQDAQGTNCSEYAEFGYCEDGTTKKDDSAGTNCSEYTPDYGMCDDGLTKKEDAEGNNCPGPEPEVNENDPCDLENGGQGTYQYVGDELQCLPEPPEFGFCQDGVTEKADKEGTNCPEYAPFGYCQDNQTKKDDAQGTNCDEYAEFGYCQDGTTKKDNKEGTNCSEYSEFGYCEDGTTKKQDAQGTNCSEYVQPIDCTQPRPTGTITFDLIDAQKRWDAECADKHCPDGSLIESHVNGDCQLGLTSDCQDPQTDDEKKNCGWLECGTDTANPGLFVTSLDQCGTKPEIGEEGDDCTVEIPAFYAPSCPNASMSLVSGKVEGGKCVPTLGQSCQSVLSNCEPTSNGVVRTSQYSDSGYACEGTNAPEGDLDCTKEGYTGDKVYNAHFGKCMNPCPEANQVRAYDGRCREIGSECIQQQYGNEVCTGIGTDRGILQADGTCVCPEPEVDCSEITETNYEDCNKVKCPAGSTTPYADSIDDCVAAPTPTCEENDPNSESDGQGGCQCKQDYALDNDQNSPTFGTCQPTKLPPEECKDDQGNPTGAENYPACDVCPKGQDFNDKGICVDTTTEECVTPDGTATGAIPPDCSECPTGQDFNTSGICVDTIVPEICNDPNAVNNGQDGPCECKPGFTKNAEGLCFQGDELCENGATKESGCDICPDGTSVIEYEDGICPGPNTTCENGATDFPACTTCPEGQSMDDSGNCVGGPDDGGGDGTTSAGGSLGGGGGMMTGISGYMGDPQLLSRTDFPITDFLAGLFSNLRGK